MVCIEQQKKKISGRVVQYWNGLPREVVQFPSLDVFMTWLDKVTADLFKCWQQFCFEQNVGLETSRGPF